MRLVAVPVALTLLVAPAAAAADPSVTAAPGRIAVTYDESRRAHERFGALAAAPDGTVLAAGASGRSRRLAITSIAPDGSLVREFGAGGGTRAPVDVRDGDALVRGADGTLVAIGRLPAADGSTLGPPAAVRVSAGGAFDRGFDGDGAAEVPGISQLGCFGCRAVALAPDGGVLVAGLAGRGPDGFRFAVARLRPDGSPDPAFGTDGVAEPLAGPGCATSLVVHPSGQIVVLGFRGTGADPDAQRTVLAGLRPDGSLDPAFGTGGVVELGEPAFQLAQDAAGRLLVGAISDDTAVLRFLPGGAPDPTWGSGGRAGLGEQIVGDVRPVAGGAVVAENFAGRVTQIRLDEGGRIVSRHRTRLPFGGGSFLRGRLRPLGQRSFTGASLALRPDGSLAAGGGVEITREAEGDTFAHSEAGLAFVRPDGSLASTIRSARPRVRAKLRRDRLGKVRRRGALRVRFAPGRRGLARVTARARGRTIARGMVPFWTARRTTARVPLTRAGRRLAGSARRLRVHVRVKRNDMAGNRRSGRARATLRR